MYVRTYLYMHTYMLYEHTYMQVSVWLGHVLYVRLSLRSCDLMLTEAADRCNPKSSYHTHHYLPPVYTRNPRQYKTRTYVRTYLGGLDSQKEFTARLKQYAYIVGRKCFGLMPFTSLFTIKATCHC